MLDRVRLRTPAGSLVPLTGVAQIVDGCSSAELTRENQRLMVPVTARLDGIDLGTAVREVESRVGQLQLPRGVSVEIGGQRLSQRRSFVALGEALAAAVALVLLVLVFQFGSFAPPFAILAATPLALAGGVGALVATGTALNVSSLLGAILLVGLVVKNGILLLHRAEQRVAAGESLEAALLDAGAVRLRPILMTTLCTLVGLVPLALGWAPAPRCTGRWPSPSSAAFWCRRRRRSSPCRRSTPGCDDVRAPKSGRLSPTAAAPGSLPHPAPWLARRQTRSDDASGSSRRCRPPSTPLRAPARTAARRAPAAIRRRRCRTG